MEAAYKPGLYDQPLVNEHGMKHRQVIRIFCGCDKIGLNNEQDTHARRCNCHAEGLDKDENLHVEYIELSQRTRTQTQVET